MIGSAPAATAAASACSKRSPGGGGDGPGEAGGVVGVTEVQRGRGLAERVEERPGDRAMHQHAIGGGAPLARRQVTTDQDLVGGLADAGVVEDDRGVLAAHLEGEQELGAIERGLLDAAADRVAAGEAQALHPAIGDQRRADGAGAEHQVEHPGREPGGGGGLGVALPDQRRDVRRLHHDGVAGEQRRHHVGVAQVQRVVVRADHRDHAERVITELLVGRAGDRALAQIGGGQGPGDVEARQHRRHLLLGLAADLAGLEHDRVDQGRLARGDRVLPPAQHLGARGHRQPGPGDRRRRRGIARRRHRAVIGRGLEHHRAIGRGVVRAQGRAAGGDEDTADEVAEGVHRRFVPPRTEAVKASRGTGASA